MFQIAVGLRQPSHMPRRRLLLTVAVVIVGALGIPAAAHASSARIMELRAGLANHYKVGQWIPIWVEIDSGPLVDARIEVTVPDSDGVATTASAPLQPASSSRGGASALLYTRIGRVGSPITISLVLGGRVVDEWTVQPGAASGRGAELVELPHTGELLVTFGETASELMDAFVDGEAVSRQGGRRIARLTDVAELPRDWFGYESVDVLVISAADSALLRDLAADETRYAALVRWIELGGRLTVLSGGDDTQEMLAEGGPLEGLVPGKFAEVARLPETGPLERFANSDAAITAHVARTAIMVPRLVDVEGAIEAYAGQRPTDLPLVVRATRGLGEVTFAGVDLAKPPLAEWPGRKQFLQTLLRPYLAVIDVADHSETLVTRGYNDLSGALRQRLGRSFATVAPITFPVVAVLAIAYLLALGPIDYLIVHRWLRRPWAAWVTFPLVVVLFGIAALALADWRSGASGPRVNQLELIDIDTITGRARGTFWATLFSPHADEFDLSLDVAAPGNQGDAGAEVLLSWWGLPGVGIGGMQSRWTDIGKFGGGYTYTAERDGLENVPVLTSASKSLLARWTAPAGPLVEARLVDKDGLVTGWIENRLGQPVRNVRLLYNGWAYRLGDLEAAERIDLGDQTSPRRVKTIVTQEALRAAAPGQVDKTVFMAEHASAAEILSLMMFYEAAGGLGFAKLPHRYQAFCDLSRALELGRAILVADVPTGGTRLVDAATHEALGEDRGEAAVVYRFVLPVKKE